jgi:hypothetical protein
LSDQSSLSRATSADALESKIKYLEQELLDCIKQISDLRAEFEPEAITQIAQYRAEIAGTQEASFVSIQQSEKLANELEDHKCEALNLRSRVVAQRHVDQQRLADLRFVYELSRLTRPTVIEFSDLPHRRSTVTSDREYFERSFRNLIEEMTF